MSQTKQIGLIHSVDFQITGETSKGKERRLPEKYHQPSRWIEASPRKSKYCIHHIFHVHVYLRDFGLGGEIRDGLISHFLWWFLNTMNSHILKWTFSRGLTREIHQNKTTAKITTYTVRCRKSDVIQACTREYPQCWIMHLVHILTFSIAITQDCITMHKCVNQICGCDVILEVWAPCARGKRRHDLHVYRLFPQKITIRLSASIAFKFVNQSEYALGL